MADIFQCMLKWKTVMGVEKTNPNLGVTGLEVIIPHTGEFRQEIMHHFPVHKIKNVK